MSRQSVYQAKHRSAGLCVLCSRPAVAGYTRCLHHRPRRRKTILLGLKNPHMASQLTRLVRAGCPPRESAEVMNVPAYIVYARVYALRRKGRLPPWTPLSVE